MAVLSNVPGYANALDPFAVQQREPGSELDRNAFLNLLMAQLQHQDPLNPMEDTEFTAQLAQFSSLEALEEISSGVEDLNAGNRRQDMLGGVSFIGKEVRAEGWTLSKEGDAVSGVYYDLPEAVSELYVNIYDSDGVMVHTAKLGARQPGSYEFNWDGTNYHGSKAADGVYSVAIAAENGEGQPVMVPTEVSGVVSGVSNQNGMMQLRLNDGRAVEFINVREVVGETTVQDQTDNKG